MKKTLAILLVVFIGCFFCAQTVMAGGIMDKIVSEKKLKIGVAPWKNMYMWDSKTNRYEGVIADEVRNFEKETGITVEVNKTTWGGMIAGLQTGKWDAIMNGLGASVKRSTAVAFTEPYGYYCEVALIRADDTVNSFADIDQPGNVIACVAGTSGHELWLSKAKKAKVASFSDAGSAMLEVMQGRSKAFMSDLLVNSFRAKERPELKLFIPENTVWYYQAHACRYADLDLLAFLNTYVRNMKVRGWYKELGEKWGMPAEWPTGPVSQ